jgi:hypothetical protein
VVVYQKHFAMDKSIPTVVVDMSNSWNEIQSDSSKYCCLVKGEWNMRSIASHFYLTKMKIMESDCGDPLHGPPVGM